MSQKKNFRDRPWPVRAALVAAGALELGLLAAAQVDITRRPADRIRGGKLRWRLISLINVIGPLLYFRRGRIESEAESAGARLS